MSCHPLDLVRLVRKPLMNMFILHKIPTGLSFDQRLRKSCEITCDVIWKKKCKCKHSQSPWQLYIYATIWLDEGSILDRNSPISQCQNAISNDESSSSPAGYWIIPPLSQDWKDAWQRNALLRTLISCNSSVPLECFLCGFTGWYIQVMTDLVRVWLYRCVLMQQGSIKFKTSSPPLWFSYQKPWLGWF